VGFVALMLLVGRRVIPWLMHYTAGTGSRELFRLAVYALAIGVAFGAAKLFDVSFALGAFFAGMVMGESDLSQQATEEALPLRDAFAVLFFVSVGMLLDPAVFVDHALAVLATVAIIVVGKALVAWAIVRGFRQSNATAFTAAASLSQIGEFSFILIGVGMELNLVPVEARDLILAGAIISIIVNPLVFALLERLATTGAPDAAAAAPSAPVTSLSGHDVLIGYGRIGHMIGAELVRKGSKVFVIDPRDTAVERARGDGCEAIEGNSTDPEVLAAANIAGARRLFVTVREAFQAGQIVEQARTLNPSLDIQAVAQSDAATDHLRELGVTLVVSGEREIAKRMVRNAYK
jgi:monovalent cation:H+ antiporter-2, CPA2 family